MLLQPQVAMSKDVRLQWDASPTTAVTGYIVVVSLSEVMLDPTEQDVGNVLTQTLNGLEDTDDHWFCVKAYNEAGNESTCSNIVTSPAVQETVLPSLDFEVEINILN